MLNSIILFALPEFFTNPSTYFWLFGFVFTVFVYFHRLWLDKIKCEAEAAKKEQDRLNDAAKKERDEINDKLSKLDKRILLLEEVDKSALPEFIELKKDHKHLSDRVNIYQEQRIEGIVKDAEREKDLNQMKFLNNDKEFKEIKDCIKEIKEDFKKNTDKIIDKIDKMYEKK